MSDGEEVLELPRKRRKGCPEIPYVLGETFVYGCDRCMPLRDMRWVTWMLVGKRLGLPKDAARLIGDRLEKSYVKWREWFPTEKDDRPWRIPSSCATLLSRFCCDVQDSNRECVCDPMIYRNGMFFRIDMHRDLSKPKIVIYVSNAYLKIDRERTYDGIPKEYFEAKFVAVTQNK